MTEPLWLEEYAGQSVEELLSLGTTHRIDSLLIAFEQAVDQKAARVGIGNLGVGERTVLTVMALDREVHNGGFGQFFLNVPEEALLIVDALRRIGCPETAALTQEAIAALGLSELTVSAISDAAGEDDDERDARLSECDERFYDRPEDLEERLFAYIGAHKDRFDLQAGA